MGDTYLYGFGDVEKAIRSDAEAVKRLEKTDPQSADLCWAIQDLEGHR